MTLEELERRLMSLDVHETARQAMRDHEDMAADLNRSQLMSGFDADDKRLKRYADPSYSKFKNEMNPTPGLGNPDLYLTGAFHRSIKATVVTDEVAFSASDDKAISLIEKYGERILDLSEKSMITFAEEIRPGFEALAAKVIGIGMV